VARLLELGMAFDRDGENLSTTLEAAHSHRRVLHAQDRTGGALVEALEREVLLRPQLEQRKGVVAWQLWLEQGRCVGLAVLEGNRLHWLAARAVVLATGGGGHLFSHTTNPSLASGDGVVMAWQAGAKLRDLEFVQFHPTALMLPGAPHFLISEAVRGEGGRLVEESGASPVAQLPGADLAPRDAVSRALARRMQALDVDHLWLDLRPVGLPRLERQFPTILGRCRELGLEPTREPIPVAPAAHYWMGGIWTDLQASTNVPGLYAVGEVACTGVHGANRLASNSLMECLVFARQLRTIELAPGRPTAANPGEPPTTTQLPLPPQESLEAQISALRDLCWQVAGVERNGHSLAPALQQLRGQRRQLEASQTWRQLQNLEPGQSVQFDPAAVPALRRLQELQQRLVLTELLIEAALFRTESRGGHHRTDSPHAQPFWQRHTDQQRHRPPSTAPVQGTGLA
jgi:L-aspartate oxidase